MGYARTMENDNIAEPEYGKLLKFRRSFWYDSEFCYGFYTPHGFVGTSRGGSHYILALAEPGGVFWEYISEEEEKE